MTPLNQRAASLTSDPDRYMWFDIGNLNEFNHPRDNLYETLKRLPFDAMGISGIDSHGREFLVRVVFSEKGGTSVTGINLKTGESFKPFVYIFREDQIYYFDESGRIDEPTQKLHFLADLLIRISASTIGYKAVVPRTFINKRRMEKGKPPVKIDWVTVDIEPAKKRLTNGGTHASPRLHDRRGHWRTIKATGARIWVKPCKVGDVTRGMVFHDYRASNAGGDA